MAKKEKMDLNYFLNLRNFPNYFLYKKSYKLLR